MSVPQFFSSVVRWRHANVLGLFLSLCLLLSSFFLVSCSGLNFFGSANSSPTAKATPSQLPLTKLHWCNKPFIIFRDEHALVTVTPASGTPGVTATAGATVTASATSTSSPTATPSPTATASGPTTITDWSEVEPNLGFTIFLPTSLPRATCLVSASGTLHDPIFGGSFIIGYLLPNKSPISLSEAPMRTNNRDFQCTPPSNGTAPQSNAGSPTPALTASPTQVPILLCTGARDNTNIVFSAQGSETSLKQFFDALQPNIAWVPIA